MGSHDETSSVLCYRGDRWAPIRDGANQVVQGRRAGANQRQAQLVPRLGDLARSRAILRGLETVGPEVLVGGQKTGDEVFVRLALQEGMQPVLQTGGIG